MDYNFLDIINTEIVQYKADSKYYISFNLFVNYNKKNVNLFPRKKTPLYKKNNRKEALICVQ